MIRQTKGKWGALSALGVAMLSGWACGGSGPSDGGGGASSGGASSGGASGGSSGGSSSGGAPNGGEPGAGGEPSAAGGSGSGGEAACDEFEMPEDCTIPEGAVLPGDLRCTGLYSDWEARTLRCGVRPYAPSYELWADGASKQRYVWLPPGTTIDVSDPDEFKYPVGTRFWKEFHVGETGSQKLGETRYLLKGETGWLYTAYVWSEDGETATQENAGVSDLFGSGHTVPSREQCKACHEGREDLILGWDFIMLAEGATDLTARQLADEGWFSGLDASLLDLEIPGDEVERAALGYLHANCGISCHNTTTYAAANPSGLYMRLNVDEMTDVHSTATVAGINQDPSPNAPLAVLPNPELDYYDFRPLDPERSLALVRMGLRGGGQMPMLGTLEVDPAGVEIVRAWIESMTEERGYPAASP